MSLLEVPPFEALTQAMAPYSGFGPIIRDEETAPNFSRVLREASGRIQEMFGISPTHDRAGIEALENLVSSMWREGWDPETADINLFVRDFGSVFMAGIEYVLAGDAVFRSKTDLSHTSLWWPAKRLEVFPFHKMYRRLIEREGESLVFFVDGVARNLAS